MDVCPLENCKWSTGIVLNHRTLNMTLKMISFLLITLHLMKLWNVFFQTTKFDGISGTGTVINLVEELSADEGSKSSSNSSLITSFALLRDGRYDYKK